MVYLSIKRKKGSQTCSCAWVSRVLKMDHFSPASELRLGSSIMELAAYAMESDASPLVIFLILLPCGLPCFFGDLPFFAMPKGLKPPSTVCLNPSSCGFSGRGNNAKACFGRLPFSCSSSSRSFRVRVIFVGDGKAGTSWICTYIFYLGNKEVKEGIKGVVRVLGVLALKTIGGALQQY